MDPTSYPVPTILQTTLGVIGFFFPLMLFAVWAALAFLDLGRRNDLSRGGQLGWGLVVLLFPWVGAGAYHLAGRSQVPGSVKTAMIGGGVAAYLLLLLVGRAIGGIS